MKKVFVLICMFVLLSTSALAVSGTYTLNYLDIVLQNQDPNPVEPGETVELRFLVENTGVSKVPNAEFRIEPDYPFTLLDQDPIKYIGTIDQKEEARDHVSFNYKLKVDRDANEGDYEVKLSYRAGQDQAWQGPQTFVVGIETTNSILTVSDVYTVPERIKPGSEGELHLTLTNAGNNDLDDLFVTLDIDDTYFSTIGTTNEKVVNRLDPKESAKLVFKMLVSANSDAKEYKIPLKVDFTEESGDSMTKENFLTVVLDSTPDYILSLEDTNVFTANQKGTVVLSLSNTGSSNINFATIALQETENYQIISKSSEYLGNLESDDFETAEFEVYTSSKVKDELPLKVKFTYKDNYNQDYVEEREIPLRIYSDNEAKKLGLIQGGSSFPMFLLLLVIGGVGYYYYRRKKKSQAETKSKK